MRDRESQRGIWILLMVGTMLWYAVPQFAYSLFPVYDLFRYFFPAAAAGLHPLAETIRGLFGG